MKLDIRFFLAVAVVASIVAAIVALRAVGRTEEDEILRQLDRLIELASIDGKESTLRAGIKAGDIVEFFTPDMSISAQSANISIYSRGDLRRLVFQARTSLDQFSIRVRRTRIQLAEDAAGASMELSVELRARGMGESRRDRESFTIEWVKREGQWLIERIERYETIRTID